MKINILRSKFSNQICLFVLFIAFGLNSYSQSVITDTSSVNKADDIEFARQIMLGQYAVPKVLRS